MRDKAIVANVLRRSRFFGCSAEKLNKKNLFGIFWGTPADVLPTEVLVYRKAISAMLKVIPNPLLLGKHPPTACLASQSETVA